MADVVVHERIQLSATAAKLGEDLAQGSKHVDKFSDNANAKLGDSETSKSAFSLKAVKKNFKTMAKDIAFVGMAADHLTDALGDIGGPMKAIVGYGKEIALGWAIGGPVLAGVAAFSQMVIQISKSWDSVWDKMAKGESQGLFDQMAGGIQLAWGETFVEEGFGASKVFQSSEKMRKDIDKAARQAVDKGSIEMLHKVMQADPETALSEAEAFAKLATTGLEASTNINSMRQELSQLYKDAKAADFVVNTNAAAKALERQADTFGMSAEQIARYDAKLLGAKTQWIDFAKLSESGARLEAKQINAADPLAKFETRKNRLAELFKGGYIGAAAYNREILAAGKSLDALASKTGPNMGLQSGSMAAIGAINQARRDAAGGQDDGTKAVVAAIEEGNRIAAEMKSKIDLLKQFVGDQVVDIMGL